MLLMQPNSKMWKRLEFDKNSSNLLLWEVEKELIVLRSSKCLDIVKNSTNLSLWEVTFKKHVSSSLFR